MDAILQAIYEMSRTDPAVHAFLDLLHARRHGAPLRLIPEEVAELVRLQSQRWQDAMKIIERFSLNQPPPVIHLDGKVLVHDH